MKMFKIETLSQLSEFIDSIYKRLRSEQDVDKRFALKKAIHSAYGKLNKQINEHAILRDLKNEVETL